MNPHPSRAWLLALLLPACGTTTQSTPAASTTQSATTEAAVASPQQATERLQVAAPSEPAAEPAPEVAINCDAPIPFFAEGHEVERICPEEAARRGLTVLDLSNDFAPHIFDEAPELGADGVPPYRASYIALADERWDDLPEDVDPERFLELFGIYPTPRVLHARLSDAERHACHDAIEDESLSAFEGTLRPWLLEEEPQRAQERRVRAGDRRFEAERVRLGLATIEELEAHMPNPNSLRWYLRDRVQTHAIRAMQDHLVCDDLFGRRGFERGVYDTRTAVALAAYQRQHTVVSSGSFTPETRAVLVRDSREGDYLAVLRMLRERVVDATGVLEDGSAQHAWGTVFGRVVDPIEMRTVVSTNAPERAAPDWISPATEAAATALGWTSQEAYLAFFSGAETPTQVALQLPALPAYHSAQMELRVEIDRGDVWYEYPYTDEGVRRAQQVRERPTLTLFAHTSEGDIALIQWPTTIGGWKPEVDRNGEIGLAYKESPAGPHVWRDVVAAPAWLPPPGTPDRELVRPYRGHYVPNSTIFGPGYRSAYGLAMVMNHRVDPPEVEGGEPTFNDEGVRAHGSVSYGSILRGTSHGCHRLYNHLAVRLTGFLVRHRAHIRRGSIPARYLRDLVIDDVHVELSILSRGYLYELTPPVPVNVLPGNIRGNVHRAIDGFRPLPERARADALAAAAADG
jgi:hypothetical protein